MAPTLEPGDRLLVLRVGHRHPAAAGDLVAVRFRETVPAAWPGEAGRRSRRRGVEVSGDNPGASTDSRTFGRLPPARLGLVLYRYGPPRRARRASARAGVEQRPRYADGW